MRNIGRFGHVNAAGGAAMDSVVRSVGGAGDGSLDTAWKALCDPAARIGGATAP